jgi:enoyl-[acyl-carrier protein] reductase II
MKQKTDLLNKFWLKGKEFLGCDYPIIGGAMSWICEKNLVSAVRKAGGFGVLASACLSLDELREQIRFLKKESDAPFGVNVVLRHALMEEQIQICLQEKVTHIVLAAGVASSDLIGRLKENGVKTMAIVSNLILAQKLIRSGIDALVVEGCESGGHLGALTSTVLAQEVLSAVKDKVPVFMAGGIGTGQMLASFLMLGAVGGQIGTCLLAAKECRIHENFKKAVLKASSRQAIATVQLDERFPVIPVRSLDNHAHAEFKQFQYQVIEDFKNGKITLAEGQAKIENFWAGSLRKAVLDGDTQEGSLMSGQIVGLVNEERSTEEIISSLVEQAEDFLQKTLTTLSGKTEKTEA